MRIEAHSVVHDRNLTIGSAWSRSLVGKLVCALLLYAGATSGMAAENVALDKYPVRPIRLIVPSSPGGSADAVARNVAQRLGERLGQQVIVDNRPGASGVIAAVLMTKAAADGYTLSLGNVSTIATNPSLVKNLPYDPVRDFEPIAQLISQQMVMLAHPSLNVASVSDLVRRAKESPGGISFGSSGIGTATHLSGELLKKMAGIDLLHVPYKGVAPAMLDVMRGQVMLMFPNIMSGLSSIKTGRLKPLAVTGAHRSQVLRELPTISEAGIRGYESNSWFGVLAPKGVPRARVAKLNSEIVAVLQMPEIREWLVSEGAESAGGTPEQFSAHIKAEIAKWSKLLQEMRF